MRVPILSVALLTFLTGCVSADFKAVDALKVGMAKQEARGAIEAQGFTHKQEEVFRPDAGWPEEAKGYFDIPRRAGAAEKKIGKRIVSAEAYPVSHGLLGYGWIYLFYDAEGSLASFYRLQIN